MQASVLRVTKGSNPRDGLSRGRHVLYRDGAQPLSPNDSRNGSMRRALTVLLESWVNDSRDKALPRGSAIATPSKRRAAPASNKPIARNGGVSSVARIYHWSRYGAPGEQ